MATASPLVGAVACGQAPCKGRPAAAKAPIQRGGRMRPGLARKGATPAHDQTVGAAAQGWPAGLLLTVYSRSPAASPQGAADYGFGPRRKATYKQRHRPQGLPPAVVAPAGAAPVEVPVVVVAAPWQSGCQWARAVTAYAGATAAAMAQ
ncbi:hypothetical protein BHM03_00054973 [Ensete ventricosum]|nr:hypothetical protein BHM03_00054973 [Ensete ventricosum]